MTVRSLHRTGIADWLLRNLADFTQYVTSAQEFAARDGLFQHLDPRIKIAGIFSLILSVVFANRLSVIASIFVFTVVLAALSKIDLRPLTRWVWAPVLLFTGVIAIPAIFATPGAPLWELPIAGLHITLQGSRSAAYLVSRAESAATLSALLALSTPWTHLLKALRVFRAPVVFIVILGTTYRYMFVLLQTASDMSESRRSRTVGRLQPAERRRIATATIGVLLSKSYEMSNDVHLAMQSRGFRGESYTLHDFKMSTADWLWFGILIGTSAVTLYVGH